MTAANYEATREELLGCVRDKLGSDTTEGHPVARWALSVFLRTLVTDEAFRKRLSKPPKLDDAPEYIRRAVAQGEPLYRIAYDKAAFQHVLDFLIAAHIYSSLDPRGVARRQAGLEPARPSGKDWLFHGLSWPDAVRLTATWVTAVNRMTERMSLLDLPEGHETTAVQLSDGWCLVRLETPEALRREGWRMRHCVGGGSYARYLSEPDSGIYSLRDGEGKPWVTVAVSKGFTRQYEGFANERKMSAVTLEKLVKGLNVVAPKGFPPQKATSGYVMMPFFPSVLKYSPIQRRYHSCYTLENNAHLSSGFHLFRNNKIQQVPDGVRIDFGHLMIRFCDSLESIGTNIWVHSGIDLTNCNNLKKIGDGLRAGRYLSLNGCTSMKRLPRVEYIGESIKIEGCEHILDEYRKEIIHDNLSIVYSDSKQYWEKALLARKACLFLLNERFEINGDCLVIDANFDIGGQLYKLEFTAHVVINGQFYAIIANESPQMCQSLTVLGDMTFVTYTQVFPEHWDPYPSPIQPIPLPPPPLRWRQSQARQHPLRAAQRGTAHHGQHRT